MSADDRRGTVFNIGSQSGHITNIGGDQVVHGGQHVRVDLDVVAVTSELVALRRQLEATPLPPPAAQAAEAALREAEEEAAAPDPRPERIAGAIERVTRVVKEAGALAVAGAALASPIGRLASLLGVVGQPILRLLTGF